ncbi:hypothetical protein [Yoonia sp.]|uniref:hypothetical protein n=1 Tax=Yoonia sp. TaxID=2212373 RepID=UPI00391C7C47
MAVCLLGSVAEAQTSIDLSISEARAIATQALFAGDSALARDIAQAILAQLPDDRDALAILAAAAPQQGDARAGRIAGARAFALSQTDAQRYEAARLTALAATNEQRFTLATFWLRRALIAAPGDADRAQTLADARLVKQMNPWAFDVSATLTPSSNVNGGTSDANVPDFGGWTGTFSEAALPQAGWRASLGLGVSYRLRESPASRTQIGGQYQLGRVWITDEVSIPDRAFDTDVAQLNLRHDHALTTGSISGHLAYARVTYRKLNNDETATEARYYDSLRFGLDRRIPVGSDTEVTLSLGRDLADYEETTIGQVRRNTASAALAYRLSSGDVVRASIGIADSRSANPGYQSEEWTLQGSYAWAEQIGPMSLNVGAGITWADYPDYRLFVSGDGGRRDTSHFYSVNIGFPQVTYAGFTPELSVTAQHTDSNVSRFTRDAVSAGLTIRSEF